MPRQALAKNPPSAPAVHRGRRIQVRRSSIHGKGVFAIAPIAAGETIVEYTGRVITWKQAQKRHPHIPDEPNHTFFFHIDDKHVIDGGDGGSAAKWINHACGPNCEADETDDKRVFIKSDARARYGNVVEVVDNVRSAGVDDVGLLTDQKKQGAAPPAPPVSK